MRYLRVLERKKADELGLVGCCLKLDCSSLALEEFLGFFLAVSRILVYFASLLKGLVGKVQECKSGEWFLDISIKTEKLVGCLKLSPLIGLFHLCNTSEEYYVKNKDPHSNLLVKTKCSSNHNTKVKFFYPVVYHCLPIVA